MTKSNIVLAAAILSLTVVAATGCAAGAGEEEEGANDDSRAVAVSVDNDELKPTYSPRVTLADLRAAGARCAGTTCSFGGATWDCKGGGYCSYAR